MISAPASWARHFGVNLVSLYPPDGGGRIRYYERVAPLRPLSGLIRYVLERDPGFRSWSIARPRELVSCEGEYGAWAQIDGVRDGKTATRFVGAVFADDCAAVIDALALDRSRTALIEHTAQDLLVNARLGRGVCERRFRYSAPIDWQAIPSGLVANWYPPDFPNNNTNVVVLPAEPNARSADEEIEAMIASEHDRGARLEGDVSRTAVEARSGLAGSRWSLAFKRPGRDRPLFREIISLVEEPYSYTLRMESLSEARVDENRAIAAAMARSFEPIPKPQTRVIGPSDPESTTGAFGHWLD